MSQGYISKVFPNNLLDFIVLDFKGHFVLCMYALCIYIHITFNILCMYVLCVYFF